MDASASEMLSTEYYAEADKLFKLGRFRAALRLFQAAVVADPQDGDAYMAIGNCWDALKKPKNAQDAFLKALDLVDNQLKPSVMFNLGNALMDQGNYAEAIAVFSGVPKGSVVAEKCARNIGVAKGHLGSKI